MQKATKRYASGWVITIPCSGMAPRLFLEWMIQFQHENRRSKYPFLTYKIERYAPDDSETESDVFIIRLQNVIRQTAYECVEYINGNL